MKNTRSPRASEMLSVTQDRPAPRFAPTLMALALAISLSTIAQDAHALALGRVSVLSALGEPLRAEIDIPEISADEASTLKVSLASPDAFRAAGVEFSPALIGAQLSLQRRADGRAFLRLSSERTVADPFVDLIVEATWAGGRIVRDYTVLLDPPSLKAPAAAPAATTLPATSASTSPSVTAAPLPVAAAPAPVPSSAPAAQPAVAGRPAPSPAPASRAAAPAAPAAPAAQKESPGTQVTVKVGDTAAAIASRVKPQDVSLDQMLVALLRANPDAFIANNINRLKAGAVLEVPSAQAVQGNTTAEARKTLRAQSQDFNAFRGKLAQAAPALGLPSGPDRAASGKVQSDVKESSAAAQAADKLKLAKASAASAAQTDAIAKGRAADEAAKRKAELERNLADLNKAAASAAAVKAAAGAAPSAAASKPGQAGLPVAAPAAPAAAAVASASAPKTTATQTTTASAPAVAPPSATAAASAAASGASAPSTAASKPASVASPAATATASSAASSPAPASSATGTPASAPAKPQPAKAPPPPPEPEPSFLDTLMGNPLLPLGGLGVVGLGAFGIWYKRRRDKKSHVDSSFLESRLQPDSFFGVSGGQQINTDSSVSPQANASSMVYSPSQIDAVGDVDPVAEADVYLAYGRDLQAEEILKEALRTSPKRVAIHTKLLDIYGKRRDARAYESVAREVFTLTNGEGPEWEKAAELGQDLEPSNALYQHKGGGAAALATMPISAAAIAAATAASAATLPMAAQAHAAQSAQSADIDLDLDFSLDDPADAPGGSVAPSPTQPSPLSGGTEPTVAFQVTPMEDPGLTFDLDISSPAAAPVAKAAPAAPDLGMLLSLPDLAVENNSLSFTPQPFTPPAPSPKAAPNPDPNALSFDMGDLSLDLDQPSTTPSVMPEDLTGDPLETKLALAREFRDIGDKEGARELAREVLAEADGALKARAQKLLSEIG